MHIFSNLWVIVNHGAVFGDIVFLTEDEAVATADHLRVAMDDWKPEYRVVTLDEYVDNLKFARQQKD